jgi:primosomal protein N' (replication factor Y)
LLHGVTGSGKTNVYLRLMEEAMDRGEQVLYLLPEVALTSHVIGRLQRHFGDRIGVYHHRVSPQERVERWLSVRGRPVPDGPSASCMLGARSALFLPFTRLGLVIVDEEHDVSYKQTEPAPRYQGRDAAIYLARMHGANVLLGTATPSVESYRNARVGKYGLVELPDRFGGLALPTVELVDMRAEAKERPLQGHFSTSLLEGMKESIARGEQVILFRNRRGYAPTFRCQTCGWHAECIHCDVSLTYHQFRRQLLCHYCGYQAAVANQCPACGGVELKMQGFGTEKIEDELKIYLPEARIGRMDQDTVRTKDALSRLLNDFEERRLDVLIGTQMVTKGLDFGNVGLVGIVSADQLLQFPDFRAAERAFQLMVQVAGRAGRKEKRGRVIIQTSQLSHPVLRDVVGHDYQSFFEREIAERKAFQYPPFARLVKVTLRHKLPDVLNLGTRFFVDRLRQELQDRVLGPSIPPVGRVRNQYLLDVMVKMELDPALWMRAKQSVSAAVAEMRQLEGCSGIRVQVDVDPY